VNRPSAPVTNKTATGPRTRSRLLTMRYAICPQLQTLPPVSNARAVGHNGSPNMSSGNTRKVCTVPRWEALWFPSRIRRTLRVCLCGVLFQPKLSPHRRHLRPEEQSFLESWERAQKYQLLQSQAEERTLERLRAAVTPEYIQQLSARLESAEKSIADLSAERRKPNIDQGCAAKARRRERKRRSGRRLRGWKPLFIVETARSKENPESRGGKDGSGALK